MIYKVKVVFHKDFVTVENNEIEAGLVSKPEKGEANKELVRKLARHFNTPTSNVRIVRGLKSRNKLVKIVSR
jgi:hypothetical protein